MNYNPIYPAEIVSAKQFARRTAGEQNGEDPADHCPGSARTTLEWAMARIMVKPGLDLLTREYLLIASCVTLRALPQLRMHIASALKLGGTKQQIVEVIRHMISYAGGPAVADALRTATEVFQTGRGNSQRSTLNCQLSSSSAPSEHAEVSVRKNVA